MRTSWHLTAIHITITHAAVAPSRSPALVRVVAATGGVGAALSPINTSGRPLGRTGNPVQFARCLQPSPQSSADDHLAVRAGLWKFERMLETDGKATDQVLTQRIAVRPATHPLCQPD